MLLNMNTITVPGNLAEIIRCNWKEFKPHLLVIKMSYSEK